MFTLKASIVLINGFLGIVRSDPSSNPSADFDKNIIACYGKDKDIPKFWLVCASLVECVSQEANNVCRKRR